MNEKMRMGWLLLGFGTSLSPLLSAWYVVVASSIVASFYLVLSARYVVVASLYFYRRLYWRRAPRGPHPSSDLISGTSSEVLCTSGAFVGPRRRWYDAPWERGRTSTLTTVCIWDASKVTPVCKWEESRSNFPGFKTICKRELYAKGGIVTDR